MTQQKLLRPESLRDQRSDDDPPPAQRGRWRFGIRHLLIVTTIIAVALGVFGWWYELTYVAKFRRNTAIRVVINDLRKRCPPELTPRQWESAVSWTNNLHANSLLPFQSDARTIRQFEDRLRRKTEEKVNMATIDWIWAEYARVCPGGAHYQRFHEQMMEEIAAGGSSNFPPEAGK